VQLLNKTEQLDLMRRLVQAKETPELLMVRRLVEHRLEEAKTNLVLCPVLEMPRQQALAAAYLSLLRDLTRPVANIDSPASE
jgi:hypothetical protein